MVIVRLSESTGKYSNRDKFLGLKFDKKQFPKTQHQYGTVYIALA